MEKRCKKPHTWKSKFWRKKRSKRTKAFVKTAPKSYYHLYVTRDRARSKNFVRKLFMVDYDDSNLEFPKNHKHQASWEYI